MSVRTFEPGKIYSAEIGTDPIIIVLYLYTPTHHYDDIHPSCIVIGADGNIVWKTLSNARRSLVG